MLITTTLDRTVFGIFVYKFEANLAVEKLLDKGFTDDQVDIWFAPSKEFAEIVLHGDSHNNSIKQAENFFSRLLENEEQANHFITLAVRNAAVVSIHTSTPRAARVAALVLHDAGALKC